MGRVIVTLCAAACFACAAAPSGESNGTAVLPLVQRSRVSMGSPLQLTATSADVASAEVAFDAVFAEFDRLDGLLSVWKPDSEVVRLNDAAGIRPVPIGTDLRAVLELSRQVSEWTGGKFDVTFGVLSGLWKFDHDQDNRLPDMDVVRRLLPLIDYRALEIDPRSNTAFLRRKGMRVHLGGIGKGYAIDRASAILRARGFHDFMIQAGGDLYVAGTKNGQPWRLGVQDPRGPVGRLVATLDLSDGTFSTSGDYERFFIKDGRRYHHIIDPSSGEPSQSGCRSVTIVANSAALADGLSTGVFLLGPDQGMALVRRLPDVEAVIVTATNELLVTPGLKGRLAPAAAPTDLP
jgi:thiamine biosynthesis lipoprotein